MEPTETQETGLKGLARRLRPKSVLDYWVIAAFLTAVVRLFLLKGFHLGILMVFLLPPSFALLVKDASPRRSSRLAALVFLNLVALGVAIAPVEELFPRLGGVVENIPREDNRILAWYLCVYSITLFLLLPVFLFVRAIIDRRRGRPAEFSRFTCYLGLFAVLIAGPVTLVVLCCRILGLWPVLG